MRKWPKVWIGLLLALCGGLVAPRVLYAEAESATATIVINEIHYAPQNKTAQLEYVELYNPAPSTLDLSNWTLSQGIEYTFPPGTRIEGGGYVLVAEGPASVRQVYGAAALGPFAGHLSNDGDEIVLRDSAAREINRLTYGLGFPWPLAGGDRDASIGLINAQLDNRVAGAWRSGRPTPGRANDGVTNNPPPLLDSISHTPFAPKSADAVTIHAHVVDADGVGSVRLLVQAVAPGYYIRLSDPAYATNWMAIPMAPVGNDLYAADLPAQFRQDRTLVRYRVEAADRSGQTVTAPYNDDTQPNFALYVYDGTPSWSGAIQPNSPTPEGLVRTHDFNQMRPLPIYALIARTEDIADAQYIPNSPMLEGYLGNDYPWLGTLVYNGRVYDHIRYRARGGEYRYSAGKNHWKFNFNRGHAFQAYDDYGLPYPATWDKLNFSAVFQHANRGFRGEQGMFESLSYRLYNLAGVPAPSSHFVHFRVVDQPRQSTENQYEGDFWGLYLAIENLDGNFLDGHGLPAGNLYEMKDWTGELDYQSPLGVTDKSDLNAFLSTYYQGVQDPSWWRRIFNLTGYFSYRAVLEAIRNYDVDQGKNYAFYLNPLTAHWSIVPWDTDLTWANVFFGLGQEPFRDRVLIHPVFQLEYQNRLRELRDLLLAPEQLYPMINEYADFIDSPMAGLSMVDADRGRWDYNPALRSRYVAQDRAQQGAFYDSLPGRTFRGVVQHMISFASQRAAWIDRALLTDREFPNTPGVYYAGPPGYPADRLTFGPSAFSDPQGAQTFAAVQWRAAEIIWPGLPGDQPDQRNRYEIEATWVSTELPTITTITLPNGVCRPAITCRVRVRMKDNSGRWSHWSAPAEFVAGLPGENPARWLRVTELMYHPPAAGNVPAEQLEFVELRNAGAAAIDLSNLYFSAGIDYRFPVGARLAPQAYYVLAADRAQFVRHYGFQPDGEFAHNLSDAGERLTLVDAYDRPGWSFAYADDNGWPASADGQGYSLVLKDPTGLADAEEPANWQASNGREGSPGTADPTPVLINELQLDADNQQLVTFEIYNPDSRDAEIDGWLLTDQTTLMPADLNNPPPGYRLPAGSLVPAGGYLVLPLAADDFPGRLQAAAGQLTLFSAAASGRLSGYQHSANYDVPVTGVTLGRLANSDGDEYFAPQRAMTLGAPNAEPLVGPVVISQIMLAPPDDVEWLELTNLTDQPVSLYDPEHLERTWWLGGIFFHLPAGITLPPHGRLRIVGSTPATACMSGHVPAGVYASGPFPFSMLDTGMRLTLYQPLRTSTGQHVDAAVDWVDYRAAGAWPLPTLPGEAILRAHLDGFGSEPANWRPTLPDSSVEPPSSAVDVVLCSFDVFINDEQQVEIQWVTTQQSGVDEFELLRSPLGGSAIELLTTVAGGARKNPSLALYTWLDTDANPEIAYTYWLRAKTADGAVRDLAFSTKRATYHIVYLSSVHRGKTDNAQ